MVEANLGLVDNLVRVVGARLPPFFDREDMRQAGVVGLMQAAERWDPRKNSSFEAYAVKRVRGAIYDLVRGRAYREQTFEAIDVPRGSEGRLGMLCNKGVPSGRQHDCPKSQLLDELCDRNRQMDRISVAMKNLSKASERVITAHYLEDKSLHSLQAELGVRSGRISQIHLRAIAALRLELATA